MRFLGQRFVAAAVGVLALGAIAAAQSPVVRPAKSYRMAHPGEVVATAPVPNQEPETVTWVSSKVTASAVTAAPTLPTVAPALPTAAPAEPAPLATPITPASCGACAASAAGAARTGTDAGCKTHRTKFLHSVKARLFSTDYGYANPVTCGTCKSEKTFFFGSCCQFFTPGRECGSCNNGCGLGYGYWSRCAPIVYGPGTGPAMNPCHYDSYGNH